MNNLDLLAVAGEDGFLYEQGTLGVAGQGEALRLTIDHSKTGLASALGEVQRGLRECRDGSNLNPLAFVAIPFAATRPVVAVVPEIAVIRRRDSTEIRSIHGSEVPDHFELDRPMPAPSSVTVTSVRSPKEWRDDVAEAVERIRRGDLSKVALARELILEADRPFSRVAALRQLRRNYPSSYLYAVDGLVGASPELLIERAGMSVRSCPLAGTLPRSNDTRADAALRSELIGSQKNRFEHEFLSQMIRSTLEQYCSELDVPEAPEVLSLANVHHLATPVKGTLSSDDTSVLDLVAALHPTPAVAGIPTHAAVELIAELEELDRGYYAGAVGWVDAQGDGCFAVAIRCAQFEGSRARVIAGNGMVAGSDPISELEETQWKLQVMLSALLMI